MRLVPKRSWLLVSVLALCAGCQHSSDQFVKDATGLKYQVKCDGDCLELKTRANGDGVALLHKVEEQLAAQRYASLDLMLQRRLDIAIDTLRRHNVRQPASPAELALACAVDRRLQHPNDDGWQARLQGHGRGGLQQAEDTLVKAQELMNSRRWTDAGNLLQRNQAHLTPYPFHALQANLLLAEAQRRLGQLPAAARTWQQTALLAARWATRWPAPALWEQLAAQRPVNTPWPTEAGVALAALLPARLRELPADAKFTPEALVWFAVGNARLQRSEASAALSAFKRADSHGLFPPWDDFLSLYQARALLALEQAPAAVSLLTAVADRPNDLGWRLPALALLGSGKLHEGQTQQALVFLQQAVEKSTADFPYRAEAEADLGLAYLTVAKEAEGLYHLRAAQQRFQQEDQLALLLTSLENEVSYFDHAGRTDEGRPVQARIRELHLAAADRVLK